MSERKQQVGGVTQIQRAFAYQILALTFILAGCSGSSQPPVTLQAPAFELPAVSELNRGVSSTQYIPGNEFYDQYGGNIAGNDLVLTYVPPGDGSEAGDEQAKPKYLSYAIYLVDALIEPPLTLEVGISSGNDAWFWIGIADWQRETWDFSLGTQINTLVRGIDDLPGGAAAVVSPEGKLAVAVVLVDDSAPLTIDYIEVTAINDVTGLTASMDRPEGVFLDWDTDNDINGYLVYRRPANQPEAPWQQLTETQLNLYESEYVDEKVPEGELFEYRVTSGLWKFVSGVPTWFWSTGAVTVGWRQVTVMPPSMGEFSAYLPANLWNYLSIFYVPFAAEHKVEGMRNTAYPPQGDWVHFGGETLNYGHFTLSTLPGFGLPFAVRQQEVHDNASITLITSTADGVMSQVATITPEGMITWEDPLTIREAGQHVLGLLKMTRRIGAVTWNPALSRIELVDSIDLLGRSWFEYDPGVAWHVVGDRVPDGRIECRYFGGGERISFREAQTGLAVCYLRDGGWTDISPPSLEIATTPAMRYVLTGFSLPGYGLIFLTPDQRRIRMLRQTTAGEWLTNEFEELVIAKGGATISEFQLLMSEGPSTKNYMIFVIDDKLCFRYSESASLASFTTDYVVAEGGNIRDIDVIKVGTGDDWENKRFVTFVSDDIDGTPRLHYRDLDEARIPD